MTLSIGSKLWLSFASILLVFMVVGISAYRNTLQYADTTLWVTHTHKVLTKLDELQSTLKDAETGQRGYLITGEARYLAPYQEALHNLAAQISELKKLVADNPLQLQRMEILDSLVNQKLQELRETIELRKTSSFEAAQKVVLTDRGKNIMDDIRKTVGNIADQENELLNVRNEEAALSSQNTMISIGLGTLLACLLVAGSALFLTRHISQPLDQITRIAERIAAGDLSTDFTPGQRQDELGRLMRTFARMIHALQEMVKIAQRIAAGDLTLQATPQSENDALGNAFAAMISNLREITSEISTGINTLTTSSSEILATTAQLAAGSAETATAVSQTTATVEEVKQTVQLAGQKSRQVSENAQKTAQISQSGCLAVVEMISGMDKIREQTAAVAESIVRLNEQSQAIGEIIITVNDLAEQSNLLAVNAAIEAAKAGDYGKGFAVVAQEIKSLAEQSKQATAQVRGILGETQKATTAAVMATDLSSKAVDTGIQQSNAAEQSIRILSDNIQDSARAAQQITLSGQEQMIGMDQVALAMESIKQASIQNAAGTRQAEEAAHNLHALGLKLKSLQDRFQI